MGIIENHWRANGHHWTSVKNEEKSLNIIEKEMGFIGIIAKTMEIMENRWTTDGNYWKSLKPMEFIENHWKNNRIHWEPLNDQWEPLKIIETNGIHRKSQKKTMEILKMIEKQWDSLRIIEKSNRIHWKSLKHHIRWFLMVLQWFPMIPMNVWPIFNDFHTFSMVINVSHSFFIYFFG